MASGSWRIHTLGGLDFQALSTHRLLGSVGEGAAAALWGTGYKLGPRGVGMQAWLHRAGGGGWTGRGSGLSPAPQTQRGWAPQGPASWSRGGCGLRERLIY